MIRCRLFSFFLALMVAFAGCRSSRPVGGAPETAPRYRLIYLIHGDANYLYHSRSGQSLQADRQVLAEARRVGRQARHGEVFIFHQRPERKVLWLFPRKDRQFIHYRNGRLAGETRYSPLEGTSPAAFAAEAALYRQHAAPPARDSVRTIILYFGHEIPERRSQSYHASRPEAPLHTPRFAAGLRSFLDGSTEAFDLAVLSTCNNGTPTMIRALTPHARHVLASPQNLHLSHIDTAPLSRLLEQEKAGTAAIADSLAAATYRRLSSFLHTAVTLSVYDTRQTHRYLPPMARPYKRHLSGLTAEAMLEDNRDCTSLPFFDLPEGKTGVDVWYRPPQFGIKTAADTSHSGWGCKK